MEVSWDAESIKTSSWQALGPRKFKPRLLYHTARASCMVSSAYGFWRYFICIQWGTRARIDFSNFSKLMIYSRIMSAVICVGLVGRESNVSYTVCRNLCRSGTQIVEDSACLVIFLWNTYILYCRFVVSCNLYWN